MLSATASVIFTRGSWLLPAGCHADVILDRQGEMVGYYRKSWPCCPSPDGTTMDDGYPSRELVKTFDTEFGRVGLQTCFDMNFMDTWHELCTQTFLFSFLCLCFLRAQ